MVTGIVALALLATLLGGLLVLLAARLPATTDAAVDRVTALLPQTQCAQCGFPGCRPYAEALVAGLASPDLCPPGGEPTQRALAALLGTPATGVRLPPAPAPVVAVIDEAACIGCALCLPPCPVDAIVGAPRFVHTVLNELCTGCQLCLPACPVDCIDLAPAQPLAATPRPRAAGQARAA